MTATLRFAPCFVFGEGTSATRYYLPPCLEWSEDRSQDVQMISVPQTDQKVITDVVTNQGLSLTVKCSGIPSGSTGVAMATLVNDWVEQIWSAAKGKQFRFFVFSDRCYKWCALESMSRSVGVEPLVWLRDLQLKVSCTTDYQVAEELTFNNYASEYPYADFVGTPPGKNTTGGGTGGGGGQPIMEVQPMQILSGIFTGKQESATASGDEVVLTVGGVAGGRWRINGIQITSSENIVATGNTTITATLSGSTVANATVASSAVASGLASSSTIVTAGQQVKVAVTSAGGHSNVQFNIHLQGAV